MEPPLVDAETEGRREGLWYWLEASVKLCLPD